VPKRRSSRRSPTVPFPGGGAALYGRRIRRLRKWLRVFPSTSKFSVCAGSCARGRKHVGAGMPADTSPGVGIGRAGYRVKPSGIRQTITPKRRGTMRSSAGFCRGCRCADDRVCGLSAGHDASDTIRRTGRQEHPSPMASTPGPVLRLRDALKGRRRSLAGA
jgi:hypothetical protein